MINVGRDVLSVVEDPTVTGDTVICFVLAKPPKERLPAILDLRFRSLLIEIPLLRYAVERRYSP